MSCRGKSTTMLCLVCHLDVLSNLTDGSYPSSPTIVCTSCLSDSFCPPGSISDVNRSRLEQTSQAYAYPHSPAITSFDDILMTNTFSLTSSSRRCLLISPFFWALIALFVAFIILVIMGVLYYSPAGRKYFERLQCIFRHSDLIGNGELWFGGLISFAMIVLIVYGFWFSSLFHIRYPIETSLDAYFACDTSLRNTQFNSALQLLATIKSDEEKPIFDLMDTQNFTLSLSFVQTSYTCQQVTTQVMRQRERSLTFIALSFRREWAPI